jgi:hypothetical protein
MDMDELDKRLREAEIASSEARMNTYRAQLKLDLFRLSLNLKTSDYEAYKNLEARIKELEEK